MHRKKEFIKNILFGFLLFVLLFFSLAVVTQRIPIAGISVYTVLSGSMSPAFEAGDVVLSQKFNTSALKTGDIISFNDPNIPGKIITHRITKVGPQNTYTTKGDANNADDSWSVAGNNVLGKVILSIPKLGFLFAFTKTVKGFLLLIVLPGLIIIGSELFSLAKYIKSLEAKVKENAPVQP